MSGEGVMSYWLDKWVAGDTKWHESEVNPYFKEYFPKLCKKSSQGSCKTLLPLCGKSLDLKWISEQGCEVFGVECSKLAIESFFQEHGLKFEITNLAGSDVYKCLNQPITIYCCNFFLFPSIVGQGVTFDFIWDRGSFVAIEKSDRKRYAEVMLALMRPGSVHLIEAFDYDVGDGCFEGPPRSLPFKEVQKLFGDACDYELLDVLDKTELGRQRFNCNFSSFKVGYYHGVCKK
ncbi:hypothetical protein HELRODRAFT_185947 [Helobdella robusta]|uniref:thiopurine S-methyltransferase n=1 Tax=Helobdella robusta TaxID=6412 RepID=T1FNH0_HELRO|nr:hypothetical protein HELRODRAFT_185947 [Helobdella robusta]ESN95878.1 hypothetical protein HELRODRAFT_185947 [Helobdella robusta]